MRGGMKTGLILERVAEKHHMTIADIVSRDRSRLVVSARTEAIRTMSAAGICTAVIAGVFDLDPSTVLYHSSPKIKKRKCEYRRERYVSIERTKAVRVKIRPEYLPKLTKLAALTDASVEAFVNQAVCDALEAA